MIRPLIGLIGGKYKSGDGEPVYGLPQAYTRALSLAGASPVVIPPNVDEAALQDLFSRCDGVIIAGGADVDPVTYGMTADGLVHGVDALRDTAEIQFIRWAAQQDKPLLGICRGCQISNVALGGTLYRDIQKEYPHYNGVEHNHWGVQPRNYIAHAVEVDDNSRLSAIIGAGRQPVNSLHHQALKDIAPGLRVTARAPEDGIVEAVEMPGARFFLGVQWHPEELVLDSQPMRSLFDALVAATRR